nr:retrovirus-related Pol polyprotein from transposon TNT 1-94 [Tanacetum cinerariifolium]
MAKATPTQAWLWHRRLSHLNFDYINLLSKKDIVIGSNPSTNVQSTSAPSTHTNVNAEENNNDQAEEGEHIPNDEFTNPFCALTQEVAEYSSHNIGNSNVSTFNQPQVSEYRWTKDHPLEQVRGNPSRPVQTRRKLATDPKMYADHGGCIDSRKSTSGGIQFLGDKLVSWMSKKQNCTAISSAEAEYVALSASCAQVMWTRTQLQDYGFNYNKIPLYCDSQSAIAISCNLVQHSRTNHIHTRYHFIKEQVENGIIELYFVRTEYQLVDMFTKALLEDRFNYLVRRIGMRCLTPSEMEVLAKEAA